MHEGFDVGAGNRVGGRVGIGHGTRDGAEERSR